MTSWKVTYPLLLFLISMSLTGCGIGRDEFHPPPVSYRTALSDSGTSSDNRPDVEQPLTLEQAIDVALANNPDIVGRNWEMQAARAQREVATGAAWPSIHAVGGYSRHLDPQRIVPVGVGTLGATSRDIVSGDLVLTMPLLTGGQISNRIRAAELLQQAAQHRLSRTREEIVFNVSSLFFSILGQERIVESLEYSRTSLEQHRQRVQELIAGDRAARVDLLRTEVRLANLEQQLVQERNVLAIQRRALASLLGIGSGPTAIAIEGVLSATEADRVRLDDALAKAFVRRDDYLSARREVEAQARQRNAARGGRWPTVFLRGSYGARYGIDADVPAGADDLADVGSLGVSVDVPLFEGGAIRARIREETSRLYAAHERLRRLELQIRLEVETALLNMEAAHHRIDVTAKAIEQSEESLRIERQRHELGVGTITDVLDAQAAMLEAQTSHFRALADRETARAQLRLAVGGPP
jgi:outer membrane protein